MGDRPTRSGGDLFIVDNSDKDWKVRQYLHDWADLAHAMDVATGSFEIGGLLSLDGQWQKLDRIRILMGDEASKRTKQALLEGIRKVKDTLDGSIEHEKETNDFLKGVPAIVSALQRGRVECRVYAKAKFHAKAYITHARQAVIGSTALVGSRNFTFPGLTSNVELNIQIRREVDLLQYWFEAHWQQAKTSRPRSCRSSNATPQGGGYPVPGSDIVEVGYPQFLDQGQPEPETGRPIARGRVYTNEDAGQPKGKGQYFDGVSSETWTFHIGGYQVCEKWLKDRRGRVLSSEDIATYQALVIAVEGSLRLMDEIDDTIDAFGGWPLK